MRVAACGGGGGGGARATACVLAFLCAVATMLPHARASESVGNPWRTEADLKLRPSARVAGTDAPLDVAATDGMTDDAVVEAKLGNTPPTVENIKRLLAEHGLSDVGLKPELVQRAACVVRLEVEMGARVNKDALSSYLTARELASTGGRDTLLTQACDYLAKEIAVRAHLNKTIADIGKEELRAGLSHLGFITTQGTKPELVYRLGKAVEDMATIHKLLGNPNVDTAGVKVVLEERGLPVQGTTGELLDRLASYLVDVSHTTALPGVREECDFVLSSAMCVGGGGKVIAPDAVPRGLVGKWTFEDATGLDSSGRGNHMTTQPTAGTGLHGVGSSAYLSGFSMLEIPHSDHFDSADFCVTMWLYLLADATGNWRTLLHKGGLDSERTPSLLLEPRTRGIELFVSTTDTEQPAGERLWSNTFVPLRKWTHIAGCVEGRNLRIFINGLLDAENTTVGTPVLNSGPIYVGNDPWRSGGGVQAHVDELRYYTRALTTDDIQAQAHMALGGIEPSFVELGCMGCAMDVCQKSCRRGYHLCTTRDVEGGAYVVARGMGWANSETHVWTAEEMKDAAESPVSAGLCMCCRDDD